MRLNKMVIENYRSITGKQEIKLDNLIVLLGKNNEGKTNILNALLIFFKVLQYNAEHNFITTINLLNYKFVEDFPINIIKEGSTDDKFTSISISFKLNSEEEKEIINLTKLAISDNITLVLKFNCNNNVVLSVDGMNLNNTALLNIIKFVLNHIELQFIPAIRMPNRIYELIEELMLEEVKSINDKEYQDALEIVIKKQNEKLRQLEDKLLPNIKNFLPQIKNVKLGFKDDRFRRKGNIDIVVNDVIETPLEWKGDGIKNLFFIALLSQVKTTKSQMIIIDEPESHLHPEAIHYMKKTIKEISENKQILISTHSPIFVNRADISSNIIVENSKMMAAQRMDQIRKSLGIICSDNLMYADYIVLVEGSTDKIFLNKYFSNDKELKELIDNGTILIKSFGGTDNLLNEVHSLNLSIFNYLIILDNDQAAKSAVNNLIQSNVDFNKEKLRYMSITDNNELEDLIKIEFYKDICEAKGIKINKDIFKNKSLKWSDKMIKTASLVGIDFKYYEEEIKAAIVNKLPQNLTDILYPEGVSLLENIKEKVKADLSKMGIL